MNAAFNVPFSPLREELIHLDGARKVIFPARGETIFSPSRPSENLYLVESGFLKLVRLETGGREVIVRFAIPGDLCGEHLLWASDPPSLAAEVIQEATVLTVPREVFLRATDGRPQLWRMLAEILASRERELERRVALLALRDVEYRILYFLLELAGLFGGGQPSDCLLPVTQKELASYVGATRETTSSTLNALARRGLVRLGRRLMIVPAVSALQSAVQERSAKAATSTL